MRANVLSFFEVAIYSGPRWRSTTGCCRGAKAEADDNQIVFIGRLCTACAQNTLILINANVITIDKDHPSAQAFAFDNGWFTAVGTDEEILKLRTSSTIVLDLHGMTVRI